MKKALILGVTGQDGSYLAELLIDKGYEVHGMVRHSATGNTRNIEHLIHRNAITLHRGDLADGGAMCRIVSEVQPDELYNEADQDHVGWSFDTLEYSLNITGVAVGRLLEIVRQASPETRVFQPCSSNMFGQAQEVPQTERTPIHPLSPYACAKVLAFHLSGYFREVHGLFVATGILYNHESPRRTEDYVTRKITKAAVRIARGEQQVLALGNLDTQVDWGYAPDYMEAAWGMLQLDEPDDFIIATGEMHTIREFVAVAFGAVHLDPTDYVVVDPKFFRPASPHLLAGDATKARTTFGFDPKVGFKDLVHLMVEADGLC